MRVHIFLLGIFFISGHETCFKPKPKPKPPQCRSYSHQQLLNGEFPACANIWILPNFLSCPEENCECGVSQWDKETIMNDGGPNAKNALRGQFPWQVGLIRYVTAILILSTSDLCISAVHD